MHEIAFRRQEKRILALLLRKSQRKLPHVCGIAHEKHAAGALLLWRLNASRRIVQAQQGRSIFTPLAAALAACLRESLKKMTEIPTLDVARADDVAPPTREPSSWFIPPVVIPAIGVVLILAMATSRALAF